MPLTVRVDRDYDRLVGVENNGRACFRISDATYAACESIKDDFVCVTRVTLYDEIHTCYAPEDVVLKHIEGQPAIEIPQLMYQKA